MKDKYEYNIGGKVYTMKPLVLGQVNQIFNLLKDIKLPEVVTAGSLVFSLGDKLPEAIAIVLHDPEYPLKEKPVEIVANAIAFELSPEQTLEIVEDFFDCIPVSSLLTKLTETIKSVTEKIGQENG